jgi:hypothetical protein
MNFIYFLWCINLYRYCIQEHFICLLRTFTVAVISTTHLTAVNGDPIQFIIFLKTTDFFRKFPIKSVAVKKKITQPI